MVAGEVLSAAFALLLPLLKYPCPQGYSARRRSHQASVTQSCSTACHLALSFILAFI